ncbi:winged helix-turn-helix transcriptional regulator [Azospirillum sp. TSA2s]|uniref:MarR family winged helix-turn-helix transcriptional regulator n=1 Tax=Azospirillum sp. TSA2s TaxID=709810 RepID=UPI0010AADCD4|nr:MarR family winged helix-turn-helix transcriptional regulator [Azospirillum sp. TSA2s]QCG97011.1 winged helix-turn-helix transcriptional regulator [Azospirillum sp. TSA2s]
MSAPSENCPPVPYRVPLDDQLCFALYMTSMAITRTYKPMLDAMGITYPQYLILSVLGEADGATVGAIAERLALESSTVTPPVKRLEQAGLVERRRSRMDERQVQVWLTDAGRAMVDESTCLSRTLVERSGMGLAQIGSLNRQVRSLLRALGDWDESASADPAALDAGERP